MQQFQNIILYIFSRFQADFVLMSGDLVLKMTTILKEMRIAQPCSKSERTLVEMVVWQKSLNLRLETQTEQFKSTF